MLAFKYVHRESQEIWMSEEGKYDKAVYLSPIEFDGTMKHLKIVYASNYGYILQNRKCQQSNLLKFHIFYMLNGDCHNTHNYSC